MSGSSVVICTGRRPRVLHDTVLSLLHQTTLSLEILIIHSNPDDVLPETAILPSVRVFQNTEGLTKKRNAGIEQLNAVSEYVLFLDDDVALMSNFIEATEALFEERPDVVLINCFMVANGANSEPLTRQYAQDSVSSYVPNNKVESIDIGYGCNLFVRRTILDSIRFDERLPLYAMMEDHDFSVLCSRRGKLVRSHRTGLAHLASSGGRVNAKQLGYSQLANSLHLWRKGTMTFAQCFWHCWARFLVGNCVRILLPSRSTRRHIATRLHGNLLAVNDTLLGRCRPERILEI